MKVTNSPTYNISIYIAGDYDTAVAACRNYFFGDKGGCVTVTRTNYVYTAGAEDGVIIGIINYPRFVKTEEQLDNEAVVLATYLRKELCQDSFSIVFPKRTEWFSFRDERTLGEEKK